MESDVVVGILGTPGQVLASGLGAKEAMRSVGGNTGNLLFQYAASDIVQNPKVYLDVEQSPKQTAFYREHIDVLFIPAANQLNPAWDLVGWANLIEAIDKPVVIVGLGAQAKISEVSQIKLKPGTLRFIDLIKERANHIGVRGEATKSLLERHGVDSAIVTGCPSNFINSGITGEAIQNSIDRIRGRDVIRANMLAGTMEEYTRPIEKKLFELVMPHHGKIIYQTNERLLSFVNGCGWREDVSEYLKWEASIIGTNISLEEYKRKLRHRGRYYFSAPAWIDDMSRSDISIGMRIHGSIAANHGGSLGVCIPFDSRTLELVQTMGYPYIKVNDFIKLDSLDQVPELIAFSATEFEAKRAVLRPAMQKVIEQFGVRSRLADDSLQHGLPPKIKPEVISRLAHC